MKSVSTTLWSRASLFVAFSLFALPIFAQQDSTQLHTKPSFPGGINSWRKYLERNLHYPQAAMEHNKSGLVKVQVTIDESGKLTEAKALNDPGDGLAEEAERVMKNSPVWNPAIKEGKPVAEQFVQNITFSLGSSTTRSFTTSSSVTSFPRRSFYHSNQTIIIKSKRLYKEQPIENITTTEDLSGVTVLTRDQKSYFINAADALQQLGVLVTKDGFVVPEDAQVLYYDHNGVVMDSYSHLKFVGGTLNFRLATLYNKGTKIIDPEKAPIILLDGKEVPAALIDTLKKASLHSVHLLRFQDGPAADELGSKGKNGLLVLSTKLPYPDNYLYLLDGKESSNEEIAQLDRMRIDSMSMYTGGRMLEQYGEKAKYGLVRCITRKGDKQTPILFSKATRNASFPGGEEGWKKYLADSLRYPANAKKGKLEATVRIIVFLSADGTVTRAGLGNYPDSDMAQEAIRLVKEGPKWIPACMNGKNVAFTTVVVIPFKLDNTIYN